MRTTSTAKHDLKATELEEAYGHHLLEVVLYVVEEDVFVFDTVHARIETL